MNHSLKIILLNLIVLLVSATIGVGIGKMITSTPGPNHTASYCQIDTVQMNLSVVDTPNAYYFTLNGFVCPDVDSLGYAYKLSDNENHAYMSQTPSFSGIAPNLSGFYELSVVDGENIMSETVIIRGTGYLAPILLQTHFSPHCTVGKTSYYYSLSAGGVKYLHGAPEYKIYDLEGHTYTSVDGSFSQIPANQSGTYNLVVKDTSSGLESVPVSVSGFKALQKINNKLTAVELNTMIQRSRYSDCADRLDGRVVSKVKISCSNKEFKNTTSLPELFMARWNDGWSIKVTGVSYNCIDEVIAISVTAYQ